MNSRVILRLLEQLYDHKASVREKAVEALAEYNESIGEAEVRKLAELLSRDPSAKVRARAAHTLFVIKNLPGVWIPSAVEALKDPDLRVREEAAVGIRWNPIEAVRFEKQISEALAANHPKIREWLFVALVEMNSREKHAYPDWKLELETRKELKRLERDVFSSDDSTSYFACSMIHHVLEAHHEPRMQALLYKALVSEHKNARRNAIWAVRFLTPTYKSLFLDDMIAIALNRNETLKNRENAVDSLRDCRGETRALHALLELFSDTFLRIRTAAACTLGELKGRAKRIVPQIIDKARKEGVQASKAAAIALAVMSERKPSNLKGREDEMLEIAKRPYDEIYEHMIQALANIAPTNSRVNKLVLDALQDTKRGTRLYAVRAVCCMGPNANSAAPVLEQLIREEGEEIMVARYIDALSKIGERAIPALTRLASDTKLGEVKKQHAKNTIAMIAESLKIQSGVRRIPVLRFTTTPPRQTKRAALTRAFA